MRRPVFIVSVSCFYHSLHFSTHLAGLVLRNLVLGVLLASLVLAVSLTGLRNVHLSKVSISLQPVSCVMLVSQVHDAMRLLGR